MKNNFTKTKKKRLPLLSKLIFAWSAVSILLYILFAVNTPFADWFNGAVSPWGRRLMALLSAWIPFSFAEMLLLLLPVWLILLVGVAYRRYCNSWHDTFVFLGILFSGVCVVLNLFVWNFASGYYTTSLDKKLDLDRSPVTAQELYETARILTEELEELCHETVALESGETVMPYSYTEMNQRLMAAYEKAEKKYDFLDHFSSSVKPIMLSEPMSYTHITGVYTFFTGEANINVNFPDYTIPYTAAHELAHQRGIAREDEANFVAFLVCMESDDPYIRYSAYLNVYEYVATALARADRTLYKEAYSALPPQIRREEAAYSAFFEKYRDNVAADVSQATNDAYLKGQGASQGTKSYGLVAELAVAYYRPRLK